MIHVYIILYVYIYYMVDQRVGNPPAMQETWVQSQGWEVPLEKGIATYSSILAWRIPWTEEPGGYSPWGCKKSDTTEWINTQLNSYIHIYKIEYYSTIKKNEIMSFTATWMRLEIIILSIQAEKYKYHMISLICGI